MFFFVRQVYSASNECRYSSNKNEIITARRNDSTLLKFSGSDYAKAEGYEGKYGSLWTSESKQGLGQWIQFEFLKEKVKVESYIIVVNRGDDCTPNGWTFEGSNDNKTFIQLDKIYKPGEALYCGIAFPVTTSLYFHIFRVKFTSTWDSSCDHIQLHLYQIVGTVENEMFKPFTKKVVCTCEIKRSFHQSFFFFSGNM